MYRLPPPPKPISQRVLEREALERKCRRKHTIDFTAAVVTAFFTAMLIVYMTCRFVWG